METPLQKRQRLENEIKEHEEILKHLRLERDRVFQECSHTEKRWKRVCKKCGKVEYTQDTEKHTTEIPKW